MEPKLKLIFADAVLNTFNGILENIKNSTVTKLVLMQGLQETQE